MTTPVHHYIGDQEDKDTGITPTASTTTPPTAWTSAAAACVRRSRRIITGKACDPIPNKEDAVAQTTNEDTQKKNAGTQTPARRRRTSPIPEKEPVEYPTPARRGPDDNTPIKELGFCGPPPPNRGPPRPPPPFPRARGGGLLVHPEEMSARCVNGKFVQAS